MSLFVKIKKKAGNFILDVCFETDGKTKGILGASGCGKSMTLKCIAGIMKPDSGRIVLNGRTLFDSERKIDLTPQERRVGYLFQNYALFPAMTVEENVGAGIRGFTAAEKQRIVSGLLERFDLVSLARLYPAQLSGGQQQRTALARIMACRPEVLMLDEPFSALDTYIREQMHFEVQQMLSGYDGDVLMVTHSREEAFRFCDSVVIIDDGKSVEEGKTAGIFAHPKTVTAARLSGCKNFSKAVKVSENVLLAEDWNVRLRTSVPVADDVQAVGIRAHDLIPKRSLPEENGFHLKLYDAMEGPFETTVRFAAYTDDPANVCLLWWKTQSPLWKDRYKKEPPEYFYAAPETVMPLC